MVTALSFVEMPGWRGLKLTGRADAFNDRQLIQALEKTMADSNRIAIDLSDAEFLSLQFLRALRFFSQELGKKGGEFVLVRPSHSVRRQIEIFFSPKAFRIFSSQQELQSGQFVVPRAEFHSSHSF